MGVCVVKGCSNYSTKKNNPAKVSFHTFPKDPIIAALWIEKLRLNRRDEFWKPTMFTKICSIHFDDKVKYTTKRGFIKLREGSVPKKGLHLDCLEECQSRNQGLHNPHELDTPPLRPHTSCTEEEGQLSQDHDSHTPREQVAPNPVSRKDMDLESILEKFALRRQLRMKTALLHKHKRKVRALQQIVHRLKKKNLFLQNILKELKQRFIDTD